MDYGQWEKISDTEFLKFDRIPKAEQLSVHPDICAMLYLENIGATGDKGDIVVGSEHDIVWLDACIDDLTEADIIYLCRCGIHLDTEFDSLAMFT